MKIIKPDTNQIKELIKIYKEVFPAHNIFQKKPENEIFNYLKTAGDIYAAVKDNNVVGGMLIVVELENPEFKRSRIKHVAVAKEFQDKGIGSEMLKKAEEIIGRGKIEIHMAQAVGEPLEFYTKNGYKVEGKLKSHYRPGEKCTILGKVIR
ncbi:GNAT family N-acetyltransferase [Candidatus Woesearchaeota archaeon]|nr:GNAT family N-acetyltransferase [Candidatus Woesearchaeota archaeon]